MTSARVARDRENTRRQPDKVFAEIRYQDDSGPQTFSSRKTKSASAAAAKTCGSTCRSMPATKSRASTSAYRRDPATGAFAIVDKSRNGTWLNGKRIARDVEQMLPDRAEIGVAEVVKLSFEARK